MTLRWTKGILGVLACLLVSGVVLAVDVPLRDWEVRLQGMVVHSPDGIGKAVDITQGIGFVAIIPCRVVDTRPSQGFPAAWGPPILAANATRNFDLNSAPHCTGIPAGVGAYSVNFTIAEPVGPGDLRAYPQGSPPVTPTSIMNWSGSGAAFAIANSAVIPAGTGGGITVQVAGSNAHLIIDINGYFTEEYNTDNYFSVVSNYGFPGGVIYGQNLNTTVAGFGGNFEANTTQARGGGLRGTAIPGTGQTQGVLGETNSSDAGAAGVFGVDGTIEETDSWCPSCGSAGVRGHSNTRNGVLGVSSGVSFGGTVGIRVDPATGAYLSEGSLGFTSGAIEYGVFANSGTIGCNGCTKMFVEPHPTDATKVIRYVSLEGPEAGTYFRGRAKFQRGLATIKVPESFRMVSDPEGLSIQVTPIGSMASVAVLRIDLDEIVVQGSRDVEFFYTVNGVRPGFKDFEAVGEGQEFVPKSADWKMPDTWNHDVKRRLIANGTYNEDGTPNMKTAKRLGWDKRWKKTEKGSPDAPGDAPAGQK